MDADARGRPVCERPEMLWKTVFGASNVSNTRPPPQLPCSLPRSMLSHMLSFLDEVAYGGSRHVARLHSHCAILRSLHTLHGLSLSVGGGEEEEERSFMPRASCKRKKKSSPAEPQEGIPKEEGLWSVGVVCCLSPQAGKPCRARLTQKRHAGALHLTMPQVFPGVRCVLSSEYRGRRNDWRVECGFLHGLVLGDLHRVFRGTCGFFGLLHMSEGHLRIGPLLFP